MQGNRTSFYKKLISIKQTNNSQFHIKIAFIGQTYTMSIIHTRTLYLWSTIKQNVYNYYYKQYNIKS